MLKKIMLTLALAFLPLASIAADLTPPEKMPAGIYKLDPTHASLTWKVSHLGLSNYTARFTKFDATLDFNPADPTKSKLVAVVDPNSIRTDYPDADKKNFDEKLSAGADWFNSGKFTEIKYESTKIERTGKNKAKIFGTLTLLGVTKPLTLDATFNGAYLEKPFANVPALGFSATAKLKRSEWGLGTYIPAIGDDVSLLIETEFHQQK